MNSTGSSAPRRRLRSTVAAILALTALTAACLTGISITAGPAETAQAAPGNPGVPAAPTVLYQEDFQNGSGVTNLPNYVSDTGSTYTASNYWLDIQSCNGFVLSYQDQYRSPYCHSYGDMQNWMYNFDSTRRMSYGLGLLTPAIPPQNNRAVSSNTSPQSAGEQAATNQIEFATNGQLNLPSASGRFVTFSVDAAATACTPLLRFYFRNAAGVETPVSSSAINPCNDPRALYTTVDGAGVRYGRFPANGSTLLQSSSVGIVMRNESTTPPGNGNDGAFDNIRVLDATPQLDKAFSPARVETGATSTLTFTVTNTSDLAAKNGWSFTDTLPTGLTVANPTALGGTCTATKAAQAGGNTITVTNGQLAAGTQSCTVTVRVTSPVAGTFTNGPSNVTQVGLNPPGTTTVTFTPPSYTVQKSVSATTANPGQKLIYTIQVKNTGEWAYDNNAPAGLQRASFTDDLSDVTDDADYNGDISNGASVTGNTLSWTGTLAVGQTQTFTYSVTPKNPADPADAGNRRLINRAAPTGPGGTCVPNQCTTATPVQALQITKTADQTDVIPGSTIVYTVTVKNTGTVAYTTGANAASFSDDLTKVLDDADWNNNATTATAGTTNFTRPTLTWSGPVAPGDTVTVKYSVTVKNPDTGDSQIDNAVTSPTPGNNCATGTTDQACSVQIPAASYTVQKTASSAAVNPGDTVLYTVTVTNTGARAYTTADPARFTDDLSNVVDDAKYNNDATNGASINANGDTLSWEGALPLRGTVTITYSVTVRNPDPGDHTLTNAVVPTGPGGRCTSPAACTTTTGVREYTVAKTSSTQTVVEGDVVTYTVTVTNTGTAAYTDQVPASFTDDLSDVVDDATYRQGSATNGATLNTSGDALTWSGQLGVGQSIQVSYSVTVNTPDTGNKSLVNAVSPTGPGGTCATTGGCTTTTAVKSFTVEKRASSATTTPGSRVTYTVTVTNTGTAAYTTDARASFTDDLTRVVDDATYNGDAVSASNGTDPGVVNFTKPTLSWTGPLAVRGTVTVTYTVTVNTPDTGDHILTNAVVPTGPGGTCTSAGACTTTTPVQSIAFTKVADTTKVIPGDEVNYTITVTNTGQVDYPAATFTDDLTNVLDDATYNNNGAATAGTTAYARPTFSWTGPVGIGQTVTVTYSVTVNTPDAGDKILDNAVVSNLPGSGCATTNSDPDCRSVVPAGAYTVTKTASSGTATPGTKVTYTVTVTNTGRTAYTASRPASFQDNLIQVLDDASYNGDATATSGTTAYTRPNLTWSGALPVGGKVTVTYSATVNTPDTGDRRIINSVAPTGAGGLCTSDTACVTATGVEGGFVVRTGGTAIAAPYTAAEWLAAIGIGAAALLGSAAIWFRRRTHRSSRP